MLLRLILCLSAISLAQQCVSTDYLISKSVAVTTWMLGDPDASMNGRMNWRTDPRPYALLQYNKYTNSFWMEWDGSIIPTIGLGKRINVTFGSIEP